MLPEPDPLLSLPVRTTQLRNYTPTHAIQPPSQTVTHAIQPISYLNHSAIHATQAIHDSAQVGDVFTVREAVDLAISVNVKKNGCWTLARAVKAFEKTIGRELPFKELECVFSLWWSLAKSKLEENANLVTYRNDFMACYRKANAPLGQNSIEHAINAEPRKEDEIRYGDKNAKIMAVCRELQKLSGDSPFFLSVRDAARAINTENLYTARNTLSALVVARVLKEVQKGQAKGRKATSYLFNEQEPSAAPLAD